MSMAVVLFLAVMREFPGAEFTVIGREIAARWKALEAAPRQRYEDLALRDMERYKQEIRWLLDFFV